MVTGARATRADPERRHGRPRHTTGVPAPGADGIRMPNLLLSRAMRPWQGRTAARWGVVPRPADAPKAHAPGLDPDRVLIFGSGPAAGWGVRSHELGLAGQLARQLSALTGRGTDVDVVSEPALPIRSAARALRGTRLWRYDAILMTVGTDDALRFLPLPEWERRMMALLRLLLSSSSASTRIVVAGIQPVTSLPGFHSPAGAAIDVHARRMNRVTRLLSLTLPRVKFVELPGPAHVFAERPGGCAEAYEEWARQVAPEMKHRLPAISAMGATSARRLRDRPDDERDRQHAVDRVRLELRDAGDASDRIVELARQMFGTPFAAASLLDGDRQRHLATAGFVRPWIDRTVGFCHHTIRQSEALIVPDARRDERFADSPIVAGEPGIRFYAGFPVESPDGYRIGTLCVLDTKPRTVDQAALSQLRDLAKLLQRELGQGKTVAAS